MSVADYVAPGRCTCCGHKLITWTPAAIVAAAQRWNEQHGQPPFAREWANGTAEHPAYMAVRNMFGSWSRMMLAAGFHPRKQGPVPTWTPDLIANAILDHLLRSGRWPTDREWQAPVNGVARPSTHTVKLVFGTWNAAKRFAGWDGKQRKRPPRHAHPCVGCGGALDNVTVGCAPCRDRARRRAKRKQEVSA